MTHSRFNKESRTYLKVRDFIENNMNELTDKELDALASLLSFELWDREQRDMDEEFDIGVDDDNIDDSSESQEEK